MFPRWLSLLLLADGLWLAWQSTAAGPALFVVGVVVILAGVAGLAFPLTKRSTR